MSGPEHGDLDTMTNQGEFHAKAPPDHDHENHHAHQPGKNIDGIPTFTVQTLPPGSAPKESTFTPHPDSTEPTTHADAEDTMTGSTSADVNKGLGKPIEGMSSAEMHHDGQSHRKREKDGLVGLAEVGNSDAKANAEGFDGGKK
ncbi:hypothetical protein K504DRAFT_497312 [Pleomassaria siparia CBS 279.74]|uniref:Uncharacterized protein n=1 Tax=Pleomassaria siparia CBS 279.74 TaxID=1314801 RepID=A0A6G1KRG4_9PLEO|nr:hypothetical protein K504DRAFT_497312 [Pleomassaria siparia CBS 279.74]